MTPFPLPLPVPRVELANVLLVVLLVWIAAPLGIGVSWLLDSWIGWVVTAQALWILWLQLRLNPHDDEDLDDERRAKNL